jgi:hypothetical protein
MANSPAARARRKQARKNYQSDSSFDGSSSTSSTHSSCENVSLSHRKKTTNRACACTLVARKVSIDNDDNENPQKKAADPVSTLKLNVETKPGMYIFNTFNAFLGLGNQDQNRTPMLANTPVVPAKELQELYKNQVAVPKGANNRVCSLFASLARILIVYQDPQKVGIGIGGTTGPTDHSFDRAGCSIHTDLKYQSPPDIHPNKPSELPVALKMVENCATFHAVLGFIEKLTLKLGRIETIPFRLHMIRYMCGNGMGWHSDSLCLADRQGSYHMRLMLNLGESRKICFRANQVVMSEVARGSEDNSEIAKDNQGERRYTGLGFEIVTIPGFSAYIMSSHGNGGCFLSYTDESKKVAIQAQHSGTKIGENEGGSGAFVCDFVVKNLGAAMQALNDFRGMVLVDENDDDDAAGDNDADVSE